MGCAAACSRHPVTAHAVGEIVGQVLERLGDTPPVALLAVSPGHAGALEDAAAAVRSLLLPDVLVGWVATEVGPTFPRPTGAPRPPAIGLWAGGPAGARPLRCPSSPGTDATPGPRLLVGAPAAPGPAPEAPAARSDVPGAAVALDGEIVADGWVGVTWPPAAGLRLLAFTGRRAIGPALTVTSATGPLLVALDGRPAMDVLRTIAHDQVPADDIELINRSVHLTAIGAEAPVVVRGRDRATGALVVDPPLVDGEQVRFGVVDPADAAAGAVATLARSEGGLVWDAATAGRTGRAAPAPAAPGASLLSWSAAPSSPEGQAVVHVLAVGTGPPGADTPS